MNIHASFENQWDQLVHGSGGEGTLFITPTHGDVQCVVSEAGALACRLHRLSYFSEQLGGATPEQLEAIGRDLCQRVSDLMEPLGFMENDREAACVQLRSTPPARGAEHVDYFEVTISRERGLHIARYHAPRKAPRQEISAALTRETLERLVGDCIEAVARGGK